jgi:hypothetical protein
MMSDEKVRAHRDIYLKKNGFTTSSYTDRRI